jgi:hypothetical protein
MPRVSFVTFKGLSLFQQKPQRRDASRLLCNIQMIYRCSNRNHRDAIPRVSFDWGSGVLNKNCIII